MWQLLFRLFSAWDALAPLLEAHGQRSLCLHLFFCISIDNGHSFGSPIFNFWVHFIVSNISSKKILKYLRGNHTYFPKKNESSEIFSCQWDETCFSQKLYILPFLMSKTRTCSKISLTPLYKKTRYCATRHPSFSALSRPNAKIELLRLAVSLWTREFSNKILSWQNWW